MPKARYKVLVDRIAADIRSGKLQPGVRLPTHRELAKREKLALVTASRIYTELEKMGLVIGETGRGTFVRDSAVPFGHGVDQSLVQNNTLDLNFNYPTLPKQTEIFRKALRQLALTGDLEALLRYQPHAGRPHERAIIANYLLSRGLIVNAEQVLIVSGAQHGLSCILMSQFTPGDVVAVDAITYSGFKVLAEAYHIELVAIPVTKNGPNLDALIEICKTRKVRAVYSMPTLHNPMGWVMNKKWREQLASIAKHYNLLIIEDAAYAYLADNPPPPMAALSPENTMYVSGFSKNVATGLRMGFIIVPEKYVSKIERSIRVTTWNTPSLITALVCNWILDGTVEELENEKRRDAKQRQAIAKSILKEFSYISHPSSYFLWLPLPEEMRADKVVAALNQQHISVSTAEPFSTSGSTPHALRIALGSVSLSELKVALEKIKQTILLG
ncbi:MAG: PLP-dependent aminotransferase family protein [Oceanospirillaceae bacterium]|nr:PLP-dependent aminotransferase family protein [Oceanospirillaceae bacterium]